MGCQVSKSKSNSHQKQQSYYETEWSLTQKHAQPEKDNAENQIKKRQKSLFQQRGNQKTSLDKELQQYLQRIQEKRNQLQCKKKINSITKTPESSKNEILILSREQCNKLKVCRGSSISRAQYEQRRNELDHQISEIQSNRSYSFTKPPTKSNFYQQQI